MESLVHFFLEDGEGCVETVNKDRYLNILKGKFLPALPREMYTTG